MSTLPFSPSAATRTVNVQRVREGRLSDATPDQIAVEEPLEISVGYGAGAARQVAIVSLTMRTPGHDAELAVGLLIAEGVIARREQVANVLLLDAGRVRVELSPGVRFAPDMLARRGYTSSACGVCGKIRLDTGETLAGPPLPTDGPFVMPALIISLNDKVRQAQTGFDATGGLHASALFDTQGALLSLREDVGRHNAVDKLIGAQLLGGGFPPAHCLLFLSGRVSFELVQKAVMAGIPIIASVGAPSSYAVEMADENDITLLGFVRGERFNVYTGAWRIEEA